MFTQERQLLFELALNRLVRHLIDKASLLHLAQADQKGGDEACKELGVEVLPTLQFWREGKLLWEHKGILHLQQDLGEGLPDLSLSWASEMHRLVIRICPLGEPAHTAAGKAQCRALHHQGH